MTTPVTLSPQALEFDAPNARKKFGLIALATDLTTERDFPRIIPTEHASVYGTRVVFQNPTTPENLRKMVPHITEATNLLLPGETLNAICYSCTAASVVIGDDEIASVIHASRPGVPVVTPSGAALKGFEALGINKVSILTPYLIETSEPMYTYFSDNGLDIQRFDCLGLDDDRVMARVSRKSIIDAAIKIDTPQTEAFFLSCTGLPAIDVIAEIEQRTRKPVITSNQASAWALMRHGGMDHNPGIYGKLFECDLPERFKD